MNIKNKMFFMLLVIIFFIMGLNTKVNAVSAKLSASSTNVEVGNKVTITTTIYGAAWQINISGAVSTAYSDNTDDANNQTIKKSTSFTPTSAGTYTVNLNGNVTDESQNSATPVSDSIQIKVSEKTESAAKTDDSTTNTNTSTKSKNANLKNLGITPNDFKGFKAATTSYDVKVPNSVEQVKVYATAADSKATVAGTGVQKLKNGKNSINVVVTAEDGTKKTYTINVTREESTETTENNTTNNDTTVNEEKETTDKQEMEDNNTSDLIKLSIDGYTLIPKFSPDIYEYKLNINGDISELNIVAEGANHNINVDISGNKDLQEGENVITVLVYNEETEKTTTYQIIVNKTNIDLEGLNTTLNNAKEKADRIRYIVIGVIIFIIIGIIIFIVAKKRYMNQLDNEEQDYEYDEEDKNKFEKFEENYNENIDEEDESEFDRLQEEKITTIDIDEEDEIETIIPRKGRKKGKHF